MSRFQEKNKLLSNLEVVESSKVWVKDKKNKYKIDPKLEVYGKVEKGVSSCITSSNSRGENYKFIEDFSSLPKNCKNKVVDMFMNQNKKVVYLVKKK